jgi:hypothetical protein
VKVDKTAPSIAYGTHPATYTVDQQVSIGCSAGDGLSGLASNTCADITGPAYTFGLGPHSFNASASDKAGNSAGRSTSFTVQVTPTSLCKLTQTFVQGSAKYQGLETAQKTAINQTLTALCQRLDGVVPKLNAAQKTALVTLYKTGVAALKTDGWLTAVQAATLTGLASGL